MGASAEKIKGTDDENKHESRKRWRRLPSFRKRGVCLNPDDKQNKAPSSRPTTVYNLLFEALDIILQKSYVYWILNSPTNHGDEEVIKSLISVDICFYQRITRKRFKRETWRYLRDCYERGRKKHSAICRNNRDFLLNNIQPNDEFIDSLLSRNCITEEQSQFINREHSNQDKNAELLQIVRSLDDKQFANFVKCLQQTNQTKVAEVVKNGGVVIEVRIKTSGKVTSKSMDPQPLNQRMNDLRNRTKPRSNQTEKRISQLKNEDMEIVNSQPNRRTVVVWIWCRSQKALENIEEFYDSNQLRHVFFTNMQLPSTSKMINIDRNQFRKTVVACSIYINFTKRIKMTEINRVCGVTKLRDEIYVLCRSHHNFQNAIFVFENRDPFDMQKKIVIHEIRDPVDIGSSEKENCLYVHDYDGKCIWKIIIETDYKYKIIKWIKTYYKQRDAECTSESTWTVTSGGQLLMVVDTSSILRIYGSNGKLIRSIRLPGDITEPLQVVETSSGNFLILHQWTQYSDDGWSGTIKVKRWGICEVTSDGKMVIRRFIPPNKTQRLDNTKYISIDSDDRVFVADFGRVILLDSDLKWNRILLSRNPAETEETKIFAPTRLYYDAEKEHLIVVDNYIDINLFKLST